MEETSYSYIFRTLSTEDISAIRELFRSTVLTVNRQDYTQEEVADWASCGDDTKHWEELLSGLYFIAALDDKENMTGFASIRDDGYLHSMFVHKDWQRKGVASALLAKMEEYATTHGVMEITSEVSITARPFFEKHGFVVKKEQMRRANRLYLKNYVMTKTIY